MASLFFIMMSLFFGHSFAVAKSPAVHFSLSGLDVSTVKASEQPLQSRDVDLAMLENHVALFEDSQKSNSEKLEAVSEVLEALRKNSEFQFKQFWSSVFQTFQCELKDKGRLIPFCILKHLDSIKEGLHFAHQSYPEHYHYAPARTLAIMYFKMPGFVGGSETKAKVYIQEAFQGAPDFSENKKWHLQIMGRN